jgi:hypothetical protein
LWSSSLHLEAAAHQVEMHPRFSVVIVPDQDGEVIEESRIPTTKNAFNRKLNSFAPSRIATEVGAHSRWVSQTLRDQRHEVIVAHARKLRLIYENPRKDEKVDAMLFQCRPTSK